ncbi:MAG: permease-like cell division protein FtsX [Elusimicrobiaceae bacterium]|nr:permease-like cell division protein FtsX [Elusimicrobiaceae bacterium]
MDDFLQEKPKKRKHAAVVFRGYRRLFVLVLAIAVLWQAVSFLQKQLSAYHAQLVRDFKVILAVSQEAKNDALASLGESLNAKEDILNVKLFSPQDALAALKKKNPRLTQSMVLLGHEPMPAYFELTLADRAISNVRSFAQNLAAEYPQLSVKYSQAQADMTYYSGLCLHILNIACLLAFILFLVFMFMVEAYPLRGKTHVGGAVVSAIGAGLLSLGVFVALVYPTGLLVPALHNFTSVERQLFLLVFCGLLGWTLSKWQKF